MTTQSHQRTLNKQGKISNHDIWAVTRLTFSQDLKWAKHSLEINFSTLAL